MACASCRRPRPIRKPSVSSSTPARTGRDVNRQASGGQRSKITGLTYVPKR